MMMRIILLNNYFPTHLAAKFTIETFITIQRYFEVLQVVRMRE